VASGSDYAGQLTGFDTRGNDWIYLATVLLPFALTPLIGVPLLRWSSRQDRPARARMGLGLAIPIAYAPFVSIPGDYYETGSILITRAAAWWWPGLDLQRWRSDDLVLLIERLFLSGEAYTGLDLLLVTAAALSGVLAAFGTYYLGCLLAGALLRPQTPPECTTS